MVNQRLGNYRLLRLLGRGGFADVYLGEQLYLKTYAAIKILHTQLTPQDIQLFISEAQTIAFLKHPHIIHILDFGVENAIPYLVMDYAPHGTLRQLHPQGTIVPLPTIISYVKQVAGALQCAHDAKLIHRDIKPENMLLGSTNEVILTDFGIAVVAHSTSSLKTLDKSGTPHYMAPELIQGKPRLASDQYALGIIVYEWLCGTRPFQGDPMQLMYQHLFVAPSPLRERIPTIPPAIEQVVLQTLNKDPQQRFASIQAFATKLEHAYLSQQSVVITSLPQKEMAPVKAFTPLSIGTLVAGHFEVIEIISQDMQECIYKVVDKAEPNGYRKMLVVNKEMAPVKAFTPLSIGTLVARRFEVVEIISQDMQECIYKVVDEQGYRRCWNCSSTDNSEGDEYCIDCGAGLNTDFTVCKFNAASNKGNMTHIFTYIVVQPFVAHNYRYIIGNMYERDHLNSIYRHFE